MLRRRVSDSWDDAAVLAFRYGHLLPAPLVAGAREALGWALRPRAEVARFGRRVTLEYIGTDAWARRAFAGQLGLEPCGRTRRRTRLGPPAPLEPNPERPMADLEVVEIARRTAGPWRQAGYVIAPHFVSAAVDLTLPEDQLWDGVRRRRARWVEEHLVAEWTAPAIWSEQLHAQVYSPTVRARFGESAHVARRRYHERISRGGRVLCVRQNGEQIAAALVVRVAGRRYEQELRAWGLAGERDARLTKGHASEAIATFTIRAARARGDRSFGLGACYPFATGGRVRFKKRWGGAFERDPHDPRCFAVRATTEAGVTELRRVGLLHEDSVGGLRAVGDEPLASKRTPGLSGVDSPVTPEDLETIARRARTPRSESR